MTNPELELQLVLLLEAAPTRSADLAALHRQVRERLGPRSPGAAEFCRELRSNRTFLLLEREPDLGPDLAPGYGAAFSAAGLLPAPRVVLAADAAGDDAAAAARDPLAIAAASLRTLLERAPGCAGAIAAAFEQVEGLTPMLRSGPSGAGTAPSTIPPRVLPGRARGRPPRRPGASPPPLPRGSR